MDLKKVLIGLLIGTLLFCLCNKMFLVEGVEDGPVNKCRAKAEVKGGNPDTCTDENRCFDTKNFVCNGVAPQEKCEAVPGYEWCEMGDTPPTPPTPPGPPTPTPPGPPTPGPPSPALPTLSQSEIERECKNIKCPFENEKGDVQSCLTYMYKNGELVYECSADDENACRSGDDVYRNTCTNDLFSRGIPQRSNFQKREISVKNQCDRPIQIVSSIPGGVAKCEGNPTSPPEFGPTTCSAMFNDNRINKKIFGKEACPEGCTYNDKFPEETGNWLADNKDPACVGNGYGFGALKSDGEACKNTFVYRTDVISANSSDKWTEKLYETSIDLKGCSKGKFCRPGANYTAIWADIPGMPDNKREEYMAMQGKSEFTFGADYNKDDNYDASAMLIGGCGAHTNPWNNDLGFTDLSTPDQPCGDGFKINENNQTMHKKSDLAAIMGGKESTDKKYKFYGKILDKLKKKQGWGNSQKAGCFIDGKDNNMDGNCVITENNPNSGYACGFPLYYTYNDKTYLFVDDDGNRGFYDITGKTETDIINMVDRIISDEQFRNNNIISISTNIDLFNELSTAMRNELYECTSSQSKAHVDQLNKTPDLKKPYLFPNNPNDQQTYFIPFQINVTDESQCNDGSVIRNNETCSINGYPESLGGKGLNPPAETCASGYMFNFDDMNSGQQCNMEDSQLKNTPSYEIVYCPEK